MLTGLHVKNLALIKDVEIEFSGNLNVLSGETGAGKSILLNSILLALGGRSDSDMIRAHADSAFIELCFKAESEETLEKLETLGITPENGEIYLSRRILEKKSVSKVNGETVPLHILKQVAECFIEVYGQHDSKELLSEDNHLKILDGYGKDDLEASLSDYREAYKAYKAVKSKASALTSGDAERLERMDYLRFVVAEINDADLRSGEEEEIRADLKTRYESKKVVDGLSACKEALESISEGTSGALQALKPLENLHENAKEYYRFLQETEGKLTDIVSAVSKDLSNAEGLSEDTEAPEERLSLIQNLKHKYGQEIPEILALRDKYEKELAELTDLCENKDRILEELETAKETLIREAETLHKIREGLALRFEDEVSRALMDFRFLTVEFEARVTETNRFTSNGRDEVVFYISVNPGTPVKPLSEVSSGGELSRIMLAIKTLSGRNGGETDKTYLFDEVDQGISGITAMAVGKKLRAIGKNHQILLVSHLPQIVATADHHFLIEKEVVDGETETLVRALHESESISEIARLLSAGEETEAGMTAAAEMKKTMREN